MVQATLLQSVLHAFRDGQHSPTGTGARVPSGQSFRSLVQGTPLQFVLHAANDGQHSPAGMGARVPSGQILRSMVQKTWVQSVLPVIKEKYMSYKGQYLKYGLLR